MSLFNKGHRSALELPRAFPLVLRASRGAITGLSVKSQVLVEEWLEDCIRGTMC